MLGCARGPRAGEGKRNWAGRVERAVRRELAGLLGRAGRVWAERGEEKEKWAGRVWDFGLGFGSSLFYSLS